VAASLGEVKGRNMARALMGFVGNPTDHLLQLEVARLRRRVQELESELSNLRTSEASLDSIIGSSGPSFDLELHELATSSAALA
jgi:hypothetical protein